MFNGLILKKHEAELKAMNAEMKVFNLGEYMTDIT